MFSFRFDINFWPEAKTCDGAFRPYVAVKLQTFLIHKNDLETHKITTCTMQPRSQGLRTPLPLLSRFVLNTFIFLTEFQVLTSKQDVYI